MTASSVGELDHAYREPVAAIAEQNIFSFLVPHDPRAVAAAERLGTHHTNVRYVRDHARALEDVPFQVRDQIRCRLWLEHDLDLEVR